MEVVEVVVVLLVLRWSCYTVFWVSKPYLACFFKWTTAWWTVVLARQKLQEVVLPEKRFLLSNFLKVSCNELFSSLFPFSNSSRQKSTKTSIYNLTNGQHHHRSVFLVANDQEMNNWLKLFKVMCYSHSFLLWYISNLEHMFIYLLFLSNHHPQQIYVLF